MRGHFAVFAVIGALTTDAVHAASAIDTHAIVAREVAVTRAHQCKSLAIGVRRGGERADAFYGNAGNGLPPNARTEFEIGSITKTFTGTLLAWAAAQGLMRIDDPLGRYAPGVVPTWKGQQVSLLQLANHTSGFGRDPPLEGRGVGEDTLWSYVERYRLKTQPGQKYRYSNLGFGVLGLAIERAAGAPLAQLYAQVITEPLGMHDTVLLLSREQASRLAAGYDEAGEPAPERDYDFPALHAAAGLHSTLDDMMHYLDFQLGRTTMPLSAVLPTLRIRHGAADPGRDQGLGWEIGRLPGGEEIVDMDGAMYGYASYIGFVPSTGTGVVILANQAECPVWAIGPNMLKTMNPPVLVAEHGRAP